MLSCQQMTELATDATEGRLSWAQRLRYRIHLTVCGPCKSYRRQMGRTVEALRELPPPAVSPETREALLARFRKHRSDEG